MIICDTPESIEAFRLLAIRGRLKLELRGLKFKGRSLNSSVKRKYGFNGNKQKVLAQFEAMLREKGVLIDVQEETQSPD